MFTIYDTENEYPITAEERGPSSSYTGEDYLRRTLNSWQYPALSLT